MENIFFILRSLYKITGIPVHYLSGDGELTLFHLGGPDDNDPLMDEAMKNKLMLPTKDGTPRLYFERGGVLSCAFQDNREHWVVLGPVGVLELNRETLAEYARSHNLKEDSFSLPISNLPAFSAAVAMLFYQFTGRKLDETELVLYAAEGGPPQVSRGERLQPYQLDNVDEEFRHLSYAEEQKIMGRITRGEVEAIKPAYTMADLSLAKTAVGKLADKPLKQMEYMFCSSIAIATRAAIQGGLDDEVAYSIADVLLQELAKCKDTESMMRVQMETMYTFAASVREVKERASRLNYVEKSKKYLHEHINKAFTLDELASSVGVNKSYLCRKFKEAEGVTILHYTQALRVEAAENMLRYSSQDLSSIAAYLCFPSQSRFGAIFKQFTGMTPKQYREKRGISEINI